MKIFFRLMVVLAFSLPIGLGMGCAVLRSPSASPGSSEGLGPDMALREISPGIERSDARTDDETAGTDALILMDKNGRIRMNGRENEVERLVSALEQAGIPRNAVIRIQSHPQAPFDQAVRALRLLRQAGYESVALETKAAETLENSAAQP